MLIPALLRGLSEMLLKAKRVSKPGFLFKCQQAAFPNLLVSLKKQVGSESLSQIRQTMLAARWLQVWSPSCRYFLTKCGNTSDRVLCSLTVQHYSGSGSGQLGWAQDPAGFPGSQSMFPTVVELIEETFVPYQFLQDVTNSPDGLSHCISPSLKAVELQRKTWLT